MRAGGGAGRNWAPLSSTNGITWPHSLKTGGAKSAASVGSRPAGCLPRTGPGPWRAVSCPGGQQERRDLVADLDPLALRSPVRDQGELICEELVEPRLHRGIERLSVALPAAAAAASGRAPSGASTVNRYGRPFRVIEITAS